MIRAASGLMLLVFHFLATNAAADMVSAETDGHVTPQVANTEAPYEVTWMRLSGRYGKTVAVDSLGNMVVSTSDGNRDLAISELDAAGNTVWMRQFDLVRTGSIKDVAPSDLGSIFVGGAVRVHRDGKKPYRDGYVAAYDTSGANLWTSTTHGGDATTVTGVAPDTLGNVFLTGFTAEPNTNRGGSVLLAKYGAAGEELWTHHLGGDVKSMGVGAAAGPDGNVVITGWTLGSFAGPHLGDQDVFVSKYDADGIHLWSKQYGTASHDLPAGVTIDDLGYVYVAGQTSGGLAGPAPQVFGMYDAFVSKIAPDGEIVWSQQIGSSMSESCFGVATDSQGNVFITGDTTGEFGGPRQGRVDVFVSKFDSAGSPRWTLQLGSPASERAAGIAVDAEDNVLVVGYTDGNLDGFGSSRHAFLAKLVVPEPSALVSLLSGAVGLCVVARVRRARPRNTNH